jgi:hypothetical protein
MNPRKQKHGCRDAEHPLNLMLRGDFTKVWLPVAFCSQREHVLSEHRKLFCEFLNLNKLVHSYIIESLPRVAGGPPNFQAFNSFCPSQSDMLPQGRRPEGSSTSYDPVNGSWSAIRRLHCDFNAGADSGAVGSGSHQLNRDPVVSVPGVSEHQHRGLVTGSHPSHPNEKLFVSVVINISECNAMPFFK